MVTASWLIALVISAVIGAGRFSLPVVYSKTTAGEAGTAATLLLALLGVFATMLVRPGEHPLASRLLLLARLLILIQAAVVLIGVGNLVLHDPRHAVPVHLWTWLMVVAWAATGLFSLSWLLPVVIQAPSRSRQPMATSMAMTTRGATTSKVGWWTGWASFWTPFRTKIKVISAASPAVRPPSGRRPDGRVS